MKTFLHAAASAAIAATALSACAAPAHLPCASLEIVDRSTGAALPVYEKDGQRWVAGVPGHRYAVRIRNRTGERILAVLSVDGLNAITGQSAGWDQDGYVLAPRERADIAGWRKDLGHVAAFEFSELPDAYAARTGRPGNVGVVGVAVFREAPPPRLSAAPPFRGRRDEAAESEAAVDAARAGKAALPAAAGQAADATGPASALQREERVSTPAPAPAARAPLGTAHGENESSPVETTSFERADPVPVATLTIRYDRMETLVAMGIAPAPWLAQARPAPQAFPASVASFVPDPPAR